MKLRETDRHVTYADQLAGGDAPITLINVFTMSSDDVDAFLRAWTDDATFMKRQPGFIRTQLHRGTQDSATFVNIATWESTATLRAAFTAPEFRRTLARYPESVEASPHVCVPVAVASICTA